MAHKVTRRQVLKVAGASVLAGTAFAGPHVPDAINSLIGDKVDLSQFDLAYVPGAQRGQFIVANPQDASFGVYALEAIGSEGVPAVAMPEAARAAIDYYRQRLAADPAYQPQIFVGQATGVAMMPGGTARVGAWHQPFGNVVLSGSAGWGYVSGDCISSNAHYAAFRATEYGRNNVYFDVHVATFEKKGRRCYGVYESKSKFCRSVCPPTIDFWAVVETIASAMSQRTP